MLAIPALNVNTLRDPPKLLDAFISVQRNENNFSLIIKNCPANIHENLTQPNLNGVLSENNTITLLGDEIKLEGLLDFLNKSLDVISTTRRFELLHTLKTLAGTLLCPKIDNEDIELVIHPKDYNQFILRINTHVLERDHEKIRDFCNILFTGKFETDETSVTFNRSRNYRITATEKFIFIQGTKSDIEGALDRLYIQHRCIELKKKDILCAELKTKEKSNLNWALSKMNHAQTGHH